MKTPGGVVPCFFVPFFPNALSSSFPPLGLFPGPPPALQPSFEGGGGCFCGCRKVLFLDSLPSLPVFFFFFIESRPQTPPPEFPQIISCSFRFFFLGGWRVSSSPKAFFLRARLLFGGTSHFFLGKTFTIGTPPTRLRVQVVGVLSFPSWSPFTPKPPSRFRHR